MRTCKILLAYASNERENETLPVFVDVTYLHFFRCIQLYWNAGVNFLRAKWRANENRHHWFVSGQFSIELWQNNVSKTSSTHITYWFSFHKRNVICHTMADEKITWNAQCTFVFQSILFAGISHYVMNLCSMFGYTVHRKCIFAIVDPI